MFHVACAEGSTLTLFSYDKLKEEKKRKKIPSIELLRYMVDSVIIEFNILRQVLFMSNNI